MLDLVLINREVLMGNGKLEGSRTGLDCTLVWTVAVLGGFCP